MGLLFLTHGTQHVHRLGGMYGYVARHNGGIRHESAQKRHRARLRRRAESVYIHYLLSGHEPGILLHILVFHISPVFIYQRYGRSALSACIHRTVCPYIRHVTTSMPRSTFRQSAKLHILFRPTAIRPTQIAPPPHKNNPAYSCNSVRRLCINRLSQLNESASVSHKSIRARIHAVLAKNK